MDRHLLPDIVRPASADLLEVDLCSRCDERRPIVGNTAPEMVCLACRAIEQREV